MHYSLVMPSAEISCILRHVETIRIASWSTTSTRQSVLADFFFDRITSFIISEIQNKIMMKYAEYVNYYRIAYNYKAIDQQLAYTMLYSYNKSINI